MSAATAAIDPLRFVLSALEGEGALAEREGDRATALLPRPVAARLGLGEEVRLCVYSEREGDTPAGMGSPLLEKLLAEARMTVPAASVRLDVELPRPPHVRSLVERFALRNGLSELIQITSGAGSYLMTSVAYAVEADDRREGRLTIVTADDGAEPDGALLDQLGAEADGSRLCPSPEAAARGAAKWAALRAARAVSAAVQPILREIERRKERDHARIADYFAQLGAEARAPRRKTDPAAIEAKLAHLAAERDKKMADLGARYATRVTAGVAALVTASVPAALAELRLRRRKAERRVFLRIPSGARAADQPACDGCGMPAARPAACDDALHLLCEACIPNAQGRFACPACR
jgi:hypothetical protein